MSKNKMSKKMKLKRKLEEGIFLTLKYPVKWYFKLRFNTKILINELENVDSPYILIGNHVVAEDPIIANCFTKHLVRFITADTNYDTFWKKTLLNLLGSIRFSKNNFDYKAVKNVITYLNNGYPVGIYPEGGRNWTGETDKIIFSTAKLIKLAKVPVYTALYKGGYLSKPRWSQYYKKGLFEIEITKTLNTNEIIHMNTEEIYKKIESSMYHNDYNWQSCNMIKFVGKKRAEFIERILYLCPHCNALNSFESNSNYFYCKNCNSIYEINEYGFIIGNSEYDTVVDWDKWQKKELKKYCAKENFYLKSKSIYLQKFSNCKKVYNGLTDIIISSKKLTIIKQDSTENIEISNIKAVSVTLLDIFEFYNNSGEKYRFILNPKKNVSINLIYNTIKFFRLLKKRRTNYAK